MSLTTDDIKTIKQMFDQQSHRFDAIDSSLNNLGSETQRINVRLDILSLGLKTLRSDMESSFKQVKIQLCREFRNGLGKLRKDLYEDLDGLMNLSIIPTLDDHDERIKNLEREELLTTK